MKSKLIGVALALALVTSGKALAQETPAPADAHAYFINLKDGQHVKSPVTIQFGLSGMGVAPAGVKFDNTGHFHLLIDAELPPKGEPMPMDARHLHFGKGQIEATVQLTPGRHTLQIAMGDGAHFLHHPPVVSDKITITVDP